jgi:hypothetical protein
MSFGTGWFLRENERFARCRWRWTFSTAIGTAPATCCRWAPSLGTRLYWLVQFSGWDHERYVVIEPKLKTIDAVLNVWEAAVENKTAMAHG